MLVQCDLELIIEAHFLSLVLQWRFQYAAGFGKGSTSLPFWEDVYGFDMSCIGKEIVQDAAQIPIVDVVDDCNLLTDTAVLQVSYAIL